MMIILIDDERSFKPELRQDDTLVYRNSHDALQWLANVSSDIRIDQLWLDHDLGLVNGAIDSILPFLAALEERCFYNTQPKIQQVIVHTSNRVGGDQLVQSLQRYFPTVRVFAGDYLTTAP